MPRARTHRAGLFAPAPVAAEVQEDEFTATGGQTAFVLTHAYLEGTLIQVYVNGVEYTRGTDYTVSGTALTWLDTEFAMVAGYKVAVVYNHS